MLKKYGKFMADWRDSEGRRHRAAFQACRAEVPALDQATRGRWMTEIRATD